jgi:hypothetical protein
MSRKPKLTASLLHRALPVLQIPTEIQCNSHPRAETKDKTPQLEMSSNSNAAAAILLRNSNSGMGLPLCAQEEPGGRLTFRCGS